MVPSSLHTSCLADLHPEAQGTKSAVTRLSLSGCFGNGSVLQVLADVTAVVVQTERAPKVTVSVLYLWPSQLAVFLSPLTGEVVSVPR